jgi:hypothetical protein
MGLLGTGKRCHADLAYRILGCLITVDSTMKIAGGAPEKPPPGLSRLLETSQQLLDRINDNCLYGRSSEEKVHIMVIHTIEN